MRYLVMECRLGYAVVLDEEGRFLKVADQHYQVGQTVTEVFVLETPETEAAPQPKKRRGHRWMAAVAMVACLLFAFAGIQAWQQMPFASVYMTINPEVRIDVNRSDVVVDLEGVNDDGEDLIEGYDPDRKPLDVVMDELVDRAIDQGYLHEGGEISLTLDADSDEWIVSHSDALTAQLDEHLREKLSVTVVVTNTEAALTTTAPAGDSGYGDSDYGGQAAVEVPQQTPAQPATPQTAPAAPAATDGDSAYDDGGDSGYGGASDYEGDD